MISSTTEENCYPLFTSTGAFKPYKPAHLMTNKRGLHLRNASTLVLSVVIVAGSIFDGSFWRIKMINNS